ncbi:aminomethyltransferase [Planctomycetales bacterium]|nr:aminomethyltransferase [Planctomycetales bacterium]
MANLLQTPLYDWHLAHNARMVDFGGWAMPVQYTSIIHEHETVRNAAGITDVSHMGRFTFSGDGACSFLNSLLTRDVSSILQGQIRYSLLTDADGGIIDDLLVGFSTYTATGDQFYFLIVNASNRDKDAEFIKNELDKFLKAGGSDVTFTDKSSKTAMIAVQGPFSAELLQPFSNANLAELKYYTGVNSTLTAGERWSFVSRTGYTGEDGFEVILEEFLAEQFMDELLQQGQKMGIVAVGLGARDTLRLEAAMPLYGHELSESINPFEAGLGSAVRLSGRTFPGSKALLKLQKEPLVKTRIGLEIAGQRPAREGCTIHLQNKSNESIGVITSGTFSPTLKKPIAMGYVPTEYSQGGQQLLVNIRGKMSAAVIVPLPFYSRKRSFFSKGV